jgi:hypothetical protein
MPRPGGRISDFVDEEVLMQLQLDLRGLSELDHRRVAMALTDVLGDVLVREVDLRNDRALDPIYVQISLASISAVCAAIALAFKVAETLRDRSRSKAKDVLTPDVVKELANACNANLDNDIIEAIGRLSLEANISQRLVVRSGEKPYELMVVHERSLHIIGKPVAIDYEELS